MLFRYDNTPHALCSLPRWSMMSAVYPDMNRVLVAGKIVAISPASSFPAIPERTTLVMRRWILQGSSRAMFTASAGLTDDRIPHAEAVPAPLLAVDDADKRVGRVDQIQSHGLRFPPLSQPAARSHPNGQKPPSGSHGPLFWQKFQPLYNGSSVLPDA
jgi:hypothetical protein